MPGRKFSFINDGFYHVFNKTINSYLIFNESISNTTFLNILQYYRSLNSHISYSKLSKINPLRKEYILKEIGKSSSFRVEVLAFCLMPTHFHLLVRQKTTNGISSFISNVMNSFTRYQNTKKERKGPIFLTKFKAVPVISEQQLLHVSRYIHLNPYSSNIISNINQITQYPWSSMSEYIKKTGDLVSSELIMSNFGDKPHSYLKFVLDNADYQRSLESIKYVNKLL